MLGILALSAVAAVWIGVSATTAVADDDDNKNVRYQVTITNVTRGQQFTPILAARLAKSSSRWLKVGTPAR